MITYKEFEKLVAKKMPKFINASEKDIVKFVKTDDAQDAIKGIYEDSVDKVKDGVIDESILAGDCVNSAAYCLSMLY